MFRLFRLSFLVSTIVGICLICASSQSQSASQTQQRTQWFEDTIDDFLRAAQENGETTDLQVSTCKISSQQLVATAQATAARVLKGVCNPSENEDRFRRVETQLVDQLNMMRTMVQGLEEKIAAQGKELKLQYERLMSAISSGDQASSSATGGSSSSSSSSSGSQSSGMPTPSTTSTANINNNNNNMRHESPHYTPRYIPSVPHRAEEVTHESEEDQSFESSSTISSGPRSAEILKYNSTIHIESGRRVFSYYWIVSGMAYKLSSWNLRRALRSNSFYIYPRGYSMYLKIIPRYVSNTMYIHVGLTKGIYDDSLPWPFTNKMKVAVLFQDEKRSHQDLKSRMWNPRELCSGTNWRKPVYTDNPECVGLGFPHDVINSPDYIASDQIVIKLTVFLDN